MMKKMRYFFAVFSLSLCFWISPAFCIPLDLSGFMGAGSVSGGSVTLTDDFSEWYYAFYNPAYDVAADAGILSFDYTFDLVPDDTWDYLTLEINYSSVLMVTEQGMGNLSLDLSPYQGQTIDLAWVLWWGGDLNAGGSSATLSGIDLAVNPVPEPGTLLLLSLGIAGLPLLRRNKC